MFETKSADDPTLVLADAFPAEGAPAFRTACHGFARDMIETPLPGYIHTLTSSPDRLLKKAHLLRSPHPSSLQRTFKYACGRLTISAAWQKVAPYPSRRHSQDYLPDRQVKSTPGALHLGIFDQPEKD
jgi:hypothetical protein